MSNDYLPRLATGFLCCLIISYAVRLMRWGARSRGRPLPPGPRGLPIVGNFFHLRQPELWKAHDKLCQIYGDVVHLSAFGQDLVVLGSQQAMFDLLEKQSATTSDRPKHALIELTGLGLNVAFVPYGDWWRRQRRLFNKYIPLSVPQDQMIIQQQYIHIFLRKLLSNPTGLSHHIRYIFSAIIVKIIYGVEVEDENDPNVAQLIRVMKNVQGFVSGQFYVQYFAFLRHVPLWVPILGSQLRELEEGRAVMEEVKQAMFDKTLDDLTHGRRNNSALATILQDVEEASGVDTAEEHLIAKNFAIAAFAGAADTTFSIIEAFFLAMSLNPDVQERAQAELDAVVGPHRLPTYQDRASLPYLNAVLKECLRWHNVTPFGNPRCTQEDTEYRGYFIPKGTTLLANAWACMHDPEVYPDPDRFLPDRFMRGGKLDPDVCDPSDIVFGFGRRICAGRGFAEVEMFAIIAMVLHVFNITPPLDETGKPIVIEPRWRGSFLLYVEDCRCTVKPRSAQAKALLLGTAMASSSEDLAG